MPSDPPEFKRCKTCHVLRPLDAFHPHRRQCKACENEQKRRRYAAGRDLLRAEQRQRYRRRKEEDALRSEKTCTRCQEAKPIEAFTRGSYWCRRCAGATSRASYQRLRERATEETARRCSICMEEKPIEDFYAYSVRCRPCSRTRQRQYEKDNPEKVRQWQRRKYQRAKERVRSWRLRHREHLKQYKAEHYQRRRHLPDVRHRRLAHTRAYRARKREAPGYHTGVQAQARSALYGHLCWLCKAPAQAMDHVKPLAQGGSNWPANLRPICLCCNSAKGDKWPLSEVREHFAPVAQH